MAGGRARLVLGGYCGNGHLLTEKNTSKSHHAEDRIICEDCKRAYRKRMQEENYRLRKLADERNERRQRISMARDA